MKLLELLSKGMENRVVPSHHNDDWDSPILLSLVFINLSLVRTNNRARRGLVA